MMRIVIVMLAGLAMAGAAWAGSSPTNYGMETKVKAALLTHELVVAKKTSGATAACEVVFSTRHLIQCASRVPGAAPVHAVSAFVECGGPQDAKCSARPVCTYRVTVSAGSPLKTVSTGVVNVCRAGWAKAL